MNQPEPPKLKNMDDIVGKAMAEEEEEAKNKKSPSPQVQMSTKNVDPKIVDKIQKMLEKNGLSFHIQESKERSSRTTNEDKS